MILRGEGTDQAYRRSVERLRRIIQDSERIVFFGGAGVSTESGIPDFRSGGGLYSRDTCSTYAPEEVLSHSFFVRHTAEFYDYYRGHLLYPDAKPNAAHLALARLEQAGRLTAVITQNIDGLHQAAGSRTVLELHGSVHHNSCLRCSRTYGLDAILGSTGAVSYTHLDVYKRQASPSSTPSTTRSRSSGTCSTRIASSPFK